jgi:hypothetical protein
MSENNMLATDPEQMPQDLVMSQDLAAELDSDLAGLREDLLRRLRELSDERAVWHATYVRLVALRNKLVEQGLSAPLVTKWRTRGNTYCYHCTREDLPKVHRAWGRLKLRCKYLHDRKKREVEVALDVVDHERLSVEYIVKIPRKRRGALMPGCRIVKNVDYRLVCDLPNR